MTEFRLHETLPPENLISLIQSLHCVVSSHKSSRGTFVYSRLYKRILIIIIKVSQNPFQPANQ